MKVTAADIPRLRTALFVLATTTVIGLGSMVFSTSTRDAAQRRLADARREHDEIARRLTQVRSEEDEIRQKAAVFNELQSRGILGEERRLEWVELLERLRARHRLSDMHYEITPRHALDKTPAGQPALYASTMKLDLALLHEEDLIRLLDDLRREAPALIQVKRCDIARRAQSAPDGTPFATLQATCIIDWITVALSGKTEGTAK